MSLLQGGVFGVELMGPDQFTPLSEAERKRIQSTMKLNKSQVILCYECLKLLPVLDDVPREYRLMVGRKE